MPDPLAELEPPAAAGDWVGCCACGEGFVMGEEGYSEPPLHLCGVCYDAVGDEGVEYGRARRKANA